MMDGYGGYRGMGMGMGWWWIIGIIVLIAIIWPLAKRFNRNNSTSKKPRKTALDILKEPGRNQQTGV